MPINSGLAVFLTFWKKLFDNGKAECHNTTKVSWTSQAALKSPRIR